MPSFWRDRSYVLALSAGPCVWAGLYLFGYQETRDELNISQLSLLILLYPFLEEWLFRGNIQPALQRSRYLSKFKSGLSPANIITSLLFAGLHFIHHAPAWALATFFPSLIFGWAMDRFNTLMAPLVLHIFYNAGYFILVLHQN